MKCKKYGKCLVAAACFRATIKFESFDDGTGQIVIGSAPVIYKCCMSSITITHYSYCY